MAENDDDDDGGGKKVLRSKVARLLRKSKLDAPNRLILVLDAIYMPDAKIKADNERSIRYVCKSNVTSENVLAHFAARPELEARPARIPEFCEWCERVKGLLPYTVALGTTWKEPGDPQEWVAFVDQLEEQRIFTGDRLKRVWSKGTGFLFFVKYEKAAAT